MSRFVQQIIAIKSRRRRKTEQMWKFFGPQFCFGGRRSQLFYNRLLARPTAHHLVPFRLLISVCEAWQWSAMQNLRRVSENSLLIWSRLWAKVQVVLRRCRKPFVVCNAFPRLCIPLCIPCRAAKRLTRRLERAYCAISRRATSTSTVNSDNAALAAHIVSYDTGSTLNFGTTDWRPTSQIPRNFGDWWTTCLAAVEQHQVTLSTSKRSTSFSPKKFRKCAQALVTRHRQRSHVGRLVLLFGSSRGWPSTRSSLLFADYRTRPQLRTPFLSLSWSRLLMFSRHLSPSCSIARYPRVTFQLCSRWHS